MIVRGGLLHLAELPDASVRCLPGVLSVDGVLFEEQVDLVILWVVALRNEMDGHKPGVCNANSPFMFRCSFNGDVNIVSTFI